MDTPDSGLLLFRNTMRITEGHLDAFRRAIEQGVGYVEEHGPQLMVEVFVEEEQHLAHSFQLFSDSDAVRAHWKMSDPYIEEVMKHCRIEHFEIFGDPDADVLAGIRDVIGDEPRIAPRHTGFMRFGGRG